MDFGYSVEQRALRDSVRGVLEDAYPDQTARAAAARSTKGWRDDVWTVLSELGLLDTARGGPDDIGPAESGILAEEIGRVLAPEPFVDVAVLSGRVLAETREPDLLDAVCSGAHLAVLVPPRPERHLTVRQHRRTWTVTGVSESVRYGGDADSYLVVAPTEGGIMLVAVDASGPGVLGQRSRTYSGRPTARVTFDEAECRPLCQAGSEAARAAGRALHAATVASCHEAVGAMEAAVRLTTRHLAQRRQFGRSLGSFQALRFHAADMQVALEQARSVTLWASMVLRHDSGGPVRTREAVAHAKVQTARACRFVGQSAVQLHGGIGLTEEHPIGHYHAHLVALGQKFGSEEHHLGLLMSGLDRHQHIDVLA